MTIPTDGGFVWTRLPRKALSAAAGVASLIVLLLYLEGTFAHRVTPGVVPLPNATEAAANAVRLDQREVEDWVDWPATVSSRLVANLA